MTRYTKTTYQGEVLDEWTLQQFKQLQDVYEVIGGTKPLSVPQGSYSDGDLSAGTHTGGGAIDIFIVGGTAKDYDLLQKAGRFVQFAGWHRTPSQGPWDRHFHGILIGNNKAAPLAKAQVEDYYDYKSGLKGHAPDKTWHPSVIFVSTYKAGTVSTKAMADLAKKPNTLPRSGVKKIQTALNLKLGTTLKVDGKFGKTTKAAFARWEESVGGNGDGIPGLYSLTLLGAGRFFVIA